MNYRNESGVLPQNPPHPYAIFSRFDMLVNGGGAVTLQFQRSPYRPQTRTVFIPWNQIVVLPPVKMQLSDASDIFREVASGVTPSYAPKGRNFGGKGRKAHCSWVYFLSYDI